MILGGSSQGCDSLIYIDLQFDDHIETEIVAGICEGAFYLLGNDTLTTSGNYAATFSSAFGCDSIVQLALSVQPLVTIELNVPLCEGDLFNGVLYDTDTTILTVLNNGQSCDTLIYSSLQFYAPTEESAAIDLCVGDQLHGQYFETDTVVTFQLQSFAGCDSIVHATISIAEPALSYFVDTISLGNQVWFGGIAYTSTGIYSDTLTAVNGCDSVSVLDLTVLDLVDAEERHMAPLSVHALPNPFFNQFKFTWTYP